MSPWRTQTYNTMCCLFLALAVTLPPAVNSFVTPPNHLASDASAAAAYQHRMATAHRQKLAVRHQGASWLAAPAAAFTRTNSRRRKICILGSSSSSSRRGRGGGVFVPRASNMDDTDDDSPAPPADEELYASLRKRLEELENSAQPPERSSPSTDRRIELDREKDERATRMIGRPQNEIFRRAEAEHLSPSAKARERSLAWLTIQSVGVISVALALGTAVLYYLAGEYFVHLGPREYPGTLVNRSSGSPTIERTIGGANGDAGSGGNDDAGRRLVERGGKREPFHFEGFPDVGSVTPDF